MRTTMLASAAVLGLALSTPAFAQNLPPTTTDTQGSGHLPMPAHPVTGGQMGQNMNATGSMPMSNGMAGADSRPEQFLQQAKMDVQHHRMAAAQEALEHAETRLLDRSTLAANASQPDNAPAVQDISQAREALGKHDWQGASQHIDAAMRNAQIAQSNGAAGAGMMNSAAGSMGTPAMRPATPMPGTSPAATLGGDTMGGTLMNGVPAMGGTSQPTTPGMGGNFAPPAGNAGLTPNGTNGQSGSSTGQ